MEYFLFGKVNRFIVFFVFELFLKLFVDWKFFVDEVSFYFVCGMNFGQKIREYVKKLIGDIDE